jgi:hypothetical protein
LSHAWKTLTPIFFGLARSRRKAIAASKLSRGHGSGALAVAEEQSRDAEEGHAQAEWFFVGERAHVILLWAEVGMPAAKAGVIIVLNKTTHNYL